MMKTVTTALRLFAVLTVITGIIYPLVVTQIGKTIFPSKAQGSLITIDGHVVGSELIGQKFADPKYFWPRPSATDYNPLPSGGSNLGPTSSALKLSYAERRDGNKDIPRDLLFASASGLDPHMSVEAATYQVPRIARLRNITRDHIGDVYNLINKMAEKRAFGLLGEERVNVLKLNMALDRMLLTYGK